MNLVQIHLVGLPIDIHGEAAEHAAEVMREFSHLLEGAETGNTPARLLALDQELSRRYADFTQESNDDLEAAAARGERSVDVIFTIPADAGQAARELADMWDEVDRFCAGGQYLLTLKTPPRALAYRNWLLGEFSRQTEGRPPISWADWQAGDPGRAAPAPSSE